LSSCRAIRKFLEKLTDVVGLYLNPPDKAIVLCVDEKSQIQALNRTQPGLPLKPGRCGAMTHDYKRNGTTTLFAALDLLQGKVIGDFHQRHRHQEFLKFLRRMDRELPGGKTLHLVMDNYGTHGHAEVKAWLKKHPRFVIHYVPTSCSWLNLVERWFAELTSKWIRRGSFYSVDELIAAIREFLAAWNENPKPFLWTATLDCHPGLHRRQTRPLPPNPGTDSARLYRPQEPQTFVQLLRGHYPRACCYSAQLPSGDYCRSLDAIGRWPRCPLLCPRSGILAEWLNFALVVTRLSGTLVTDGFRLTRCMLSATRYESWPPARPAEFVPVSSSPSSDAEDADGGVPRQDD